MLDAFKAPLPLVNLVHQMPICNPPERLLGISLIERDLGPTEKWVWREHHCHALGDEIQRVPSPASPSLFSAQAVGSVSSRFFSW